MAKSLFMTYFLWVIGGPFGLHHFYLRRDNHAFVWWTTFGGWFLGWLRDLLKIPTYVYEANLDDKHSTNAVVKRPAALNLERCFGAVLLGCFYGFLMRVLIPEYLVTDHKVLSFLAKILTPIGVCFGVHLVCNIGREVSSFTSALKGAALVSLITIIIEDSHILYMAVAAVASVRYHGVWYVESPRRYPSVYKRCMILTGGVTFYTSLWIVIILFNVNITTETGEQVPLRTAAYNFFHSEAWRDMKSTSWYLFKYWKEHGWDETIFDEMKRKFDTSGIKHAEEVLEIDETMTEEEITRHYKTLVRKWHPDKFKTAEEKEVAQAKFIEIQSAYEKISKQKMKREMKNRQSRFKEER